MVVVACVAEVDGAVVVVGRTVGFVVGFTVVRGLVVVGFEVDVVVSAGVVVDEVELPEVLGELAVDPVVVVWPGTVPAPAPAPAPTGVDVDLGSDKGWSASGDDAVGPLGSIRPRTPSGEGVNVLVEPVNGSAGGGGWVVNTTATTNITNPTNTSAAHVPALRCRAAKSSSESLIIGDPTQGQLQQRKGDCDWWSQVAAETPATAVEKRSGGHPVTGWAAVAI